MAPITQSNYDSAADKANAENEQLRAKLAAAEARALEAETINVSLTNELVTKTNEVAFFKEQYYGSNEARVISDRMKDSTNAGIIRRKISSESSPSHKRLFLKHRKKTNIEV